MAVAINLTNDNWATDSTMLVEKKQEIWVRIIHF